MIAHQLRSICVAVAAATLTFGVSPHPTAAESTPGSTAKEFLVTRPPFNAAPRNGREKRDYVRQERNTRAINKAIAQAHEAGGGIVRISQSGGRTIYDISQIRMLSNVTLHIDDDVVLLASSWWRDYRSLPPEDVNNKDPRVTNDPDTWPPLNNRGPQHWSFYYSVISAVDCENIAVTGGGVINGNRSRVPSDEDVQADGFHVMQAIRSEITGFQPEEPRGIRRGAHLINFQRCRNIRIGSFDKPGDSMSRLRLTHSGNYTIYINYCDKAQIRGVEIHGGWDGIHSRYGQNVAISDVSITNNLDDGIAGHHTYRWLVQRLTVDGGYYPADLAQISDDPSLDEKREEAARGISQGNGWRFGGVDLIAKDIRIRDKRQAAIHHFADGDFPKPESMPYHIDPQGYASHNWRLSNWQIDNCRHALFYQYNGLWQDAGPVGSVAMADFKGTNMLATPIVWFNKDAPKNGLLILKDCRFNPSEQVERLNPGFGMYVANIKSVRLLGRNEFNYLPKHSNNGSPPAPPVVVENAEQTYGNNPYAGSPQSRQVQPK